MKFSTAFFLFSLLAFSVSFGQSQKIGYVDTEAILEKIPQYGVAQQEIERITEQWQKDLEKQYSEIETLYANYQAQEVLLSEDVKRQRQDEIFKAEREAKEYREKKFGYNGELFQLQEAKVKPIQEKVFKAVEAIAERKRFSYIFDKAGEVTWLYVNPNYDLTEEVLEELGIKDENKN
ncbi:MAG: OmpH family outer membrane protein [Bacteroidia bacterium]|nr:OmpH family outer membrane protein [Bacteroidia bacterium]